MSEDECSGSEEQIECGWCGRKDSPGNGAYCGKCKSEFDPFNQTFEDICTNCNMGLCLGCLVYFCRGCAYGSSTHWCDECGESENRKEQGTKRERDFEEDKLVLDQQPTKANKI